MTLRVASSLRPTGAALGMRWLVPLVILFGMIISSIGGTNSHGLAAIAATLDTAAGEPHGHLHEDQGGESTMVYQSTAAEHPHHGADHSHDKAHALPVAWSPVAPQLPGWWGLVRQWSETVPASRMERPPMG